MVEGLGGEVDVERGLAAGVGAPGEEFAGVGRAVATIVFGRFGRRRVLLAGRGFEQRVLVELLGDEGLDLEVGERQQLDRLLELRRHHQRLGLAQVEAGGEAHRR